MVKTFFFFIVSLIVVQGPPLFAQVKNPVDWKFESKKTPDGYAFVATATVKKPWHIYSQHTGKGGPVATLFTFGKNPLVILEDKTQEKGKLEKLFDKFFNTEVLYYADKVVFTQKLKVKPGIKTNLTGQVEYMVCDEEQCLPPVKKPFDIPLP